MLSTEYMTGTWTKNNRPQWKHDLKGFGTKWNEEKGLLEKKLFCNYGMADSYGLKLGVEVDYR